MNFKNSLPLLVYHILNTLSHAGFVIFWQLFCLTKEFYKISNLKNFESTYFSSKESLNQKQWVFFYFNLWSFLIRYIQ